MVDKQIIYNFNDSETYFLIEQEYWDDSAVVVTLYNPTYNQKQRVIIGLDMLMLQCSCVSDPTLLKAIRLGTKL